MDDRSIRIKSFSRRATGSLARRVLYASLALLGLPLLIHTFFLYQREYSQTEEKIFESLRYLAESRALYIEQMIRNQQALLRAVSDELPLLAETRNAFLEKEAKEYEIDQMFYVELEDGKPLCEDALCKDPSFIPFIQEAINSEFFVFINPFSEGQHYRLFVGKTVPSSGNPKALFIVATQTKILLAHLTHLEDSVYPLRLSLIDESGLIFLSTQEGLTGKKLAQPTEGLSWTLYDKIPNSWYFQEDKKVFLAVKIPIEGTDYTLLVDTPEKNVADLQVNDYIFRIATFLFFVCILGGSIVIWFTYRVSKPLRSLGQSMQRISEGATHVRFVPDPMGFEINAIGIQLNQMLDSLLAHQAQSERERMGRERLAQELKIGHQIQANMLPTHFPECPSLDVAPGYLSAREVSGDFYDFYAKEDGRFLIAMADGADKGISACLYSLSFRSMLRTAAATKDDLVSIVQTANSLLLCDTAESSFFITAWIGLYDPKTRKLQYCSYGHPPAYLCSTTGDILALSTEGMALGIQEVSTVIGEKTLQKGDLLFLYTDGVIEAHDLERQLFGKKRLKEFLYRCKERQSAQKIVDRILEEVHLFCSNAPQSDDLTLLAVIQK